MFQPKKLGGGFTVGTMIGGVVSTLVTVKTGKGPAALVVSVAVFPAASDRSTKATIQLPASLPCGTVRKGPSALPDTDDCPAGNDLEAISEKLPDGLIKAAKKDVTPGA